MSTHHLVLVYRGDLGAFKMRTISEDFFGEETPAPDHPLVQQLTEAFTPRHVIIFSATGERVSEDTVRVATLEFKHVTALVQDPAGPPASEMLRVAAAASLTMRKEFYSRIAMIVEMAMRVPREPAAAAT